LVLDLIITQINKCTDNNLKVMNKLAFVSIEIINEIKINPYIISKGAAFQYLYHTFHIGAMNEYTLQ